MYQCGKILQKKIYYLIIYGVNKQLKCIQKLKSVYNSCYNIIILFLYLSISLVSHFTFAIDVWLRKIFSESIR